jgi:hypothetical protein
VVNGQAAGVPITESHFLNNSYINYFRISLLK